MEGFDDTMYSPFNVLQYNSTLEMLQYVQIHQHTKIQIQIPIHHLNSILQNGTNFFPLQKDPNIIIYQ